MIETALRVVEALPPQPEDISQNYINTGAAALRVFLAFEVSGEPTVFKLANEDRQENKELFLNDLVRNPVLNNCPKFTLEATKRAEQSKNLREALFMHQLLGSETPEPSLELKQAGDMIAHRLNELSFIDAAAMLAANKLLPDEWTQVAAILKATGRELYGMPDKPQALADMKTIVLKADDYAAQPEHPLATIAQELQQLVVLDAQTEVSQPVTLSEADINYYYEILKEECQPALDYAFEDFNDTEIFTVEEMQIIFTKYCEFRGFSAAGLVVEIIPNRVMCATKDEPYVIEIGSKRPAGQRDRKSVIKSLIHEAEGHAGRIFRGRQLGSGLAGYGLKRHEIFEEALCGTLGEILYKTADSKGEMLVMAIALAAGYDNGQDRDSRDSFEALWRLYAVKNYKADKDIDKQLTTARSKAWGFTERIWRGMPTDVPGCIYTKDAAYRNTTNVIPYLRGTDGPLAKADFLRLLQAKYDPTIPDQDAYIRHLTS